MGRNFHSVWSDRTGDVMTEYSQDREQRRRRRTLTSTGFVVLMAGSLAFRVGVIVAAAVLVGVLVLVYVVGIWLVWRDQRAETKRRTEGAPPSWPAHLPLVFARDLGVTAPGRHATRVATETGELLGRLTYVNGLLRWEPNPKWSKHVTGPVTWDRTWSAEVRPIRGPGSQGCLTLRAPDGTAVDLWIKHPKDMGQMLGERLTITG